MGSSSAASVDDSRWHTARDFTRDMGACAIGNNQRGQTLPNAVGTLGFAWNQSRQQHWSEFGYPAAAPFNGQWMVVCESSHATDDTSVPGVGRDPQGVGCDMTGGSSGGPWVMGWKGQSGPNPLPGGGFVNGHNDYKYTQRSRWRCTRRTSTGLRTRSAAERQQGAEPHLLSRSGGARRRVTELDPPPRPGTEFISSALGEQVRERRPLETVAKGPLRLVHDLVDLAGFRGSTRDAAKDAADPTGVALARFNHFQNGKTAG